MTRAKRLFHLFEALQAAGPRGATPRQLLDRLEAWGEPIEERQLQRDVKMLIEAMGLPITRSDDLDDGQASDGSRVVYLLDRRGMIPSDLVSAGRAISCFEFTGCRMWAPALEQGWVLLHHLQAPSTRELADMVVDRFRNSRALYLGQFHFDHFVLEIPNNLEFDIEVRIGRIERATQAPTASLTREQVWIGIEGRLALSRLFGPREGHVALRFGRGQDSVRLTSLADDAPDGPHAIAVTHVDPPEAFNNTPHFVLPSEIVERLRSAARRERERLLSSPCHILFGGVAMYVWLPRQVVVV